MAEPPVAPSPSELHDGPSTLGDVQTLPPEHEALITTVGPAGRPSPLEDVETSLPEPEALLTTTSSPNSSPRACVNHLQVNNATGSPQTSSPKSPGRTGSPRKTLEVAAAQSAYNCHKMEEEKADRLATAARAAAQEEQFNHSFGSRLKPSDQIKSTVDHIDHAREIDLAELESKLRRFNLNLLQPTIHKTSLIGQEMKQLKTEIERSTQMISAVSSVSDKVENQVAVVEGFRREMEDFVSERRTMQTQVSESQSSTRRELENFRSVSQRQETHLLAMQKTNDRLAAELNTLQEGRAGERSNIDSRFAQSSRVGKQDRAELEAKIVSLEAKHHRLDEELFGGDSKLARATINIAKTNDVVSSLTEEMKKTQLDKADKTQFKVLNDDFNEQMNEIRTNNATVQQALTKNVNSVKTDFQNATNSVSAHNATMLTEVRTSYQEELSQTAALRTHVVEFMKGTKLNVARVEETVELGNQQTSTLVMKLSDEMNELRNFRASDSNVLKEEARR